MSFRNVTAATCVLLLLVIRSATAAVATAPTTTRAVAPEPPPFEFPEGVDRVVLQCERARDSLYLPVRINGVPVGRMIVDTGSVITGVDTDVAQTLKLQSISQKGLSRIDVNEYVGVALVDSLEIGELKVRDKTLCIMHDKPVPAPTDAARADPGVGILGLDVFGRVPFTIDFRAGTLTLHRPEAFVAPDATTEVPLREGARSPLVRVSIEGAEGWFEIDTGYPSTMLLYSGFRVQHPELWQGRPWFAEGGVWPELPRYFQMHWHGGSYLGRERKKLRGMVQTSGPERDIAGLLGSAALVDARLTCDLSKGRAWVTWLESEPTEAMLARLGNPRARDVVGVTPLLTAALSDRADVVRALLATGADANAVDEYGMTPLMVAAARNDVESTRALITAGAKHDARSKHDSYTPLLLSAQHGAFDTIPLLLDAGADVNLASQVGRTPLFLAAQCNYPEIVTVLLDHGANVERATPTGETPLIAACRFGNADVARILLEHRADPNVVGRRGTPLTYACHASSSECVALLIAAGADIEEPEPGGHTPLAVAAQDVRGTGCLRTLLAAGADPNKLVEKRFTALDYAITYGRQEAVEILKPLTTDRKP